MKYLPFISVSVLATAMSIWGQDAPPAPARGLVESSFPSQGSFAESVKKWRSLSDLQRSNRPGVPKFSAPQPPDFAALEPFPRIKLQVPSDWTLAKNTDVHQVLMDTVAAGTPSTEVPKVESARLYQAPGGKATAFLSVRQHSRTTQERVEQFTAADLKAVAEAQSRYLQNGPRLVSPVQARLGRTENGASVFVSTQVEDAAGERRVIEQQIVVVGDFMVSLQTTRLAQEDSWQPILAWVQASLRIAR